MTFCDPIDYSIIQHLRRYASYNIHELTKSDSLLIPLDEMVQEYICKPSKDKKRLMSDKEANDFMLFSGYIIGKPFTNYTVQKYYKIVRKILEIACNPESNNDNITKAVSYIEPLLSQDDRTVDMGWDLGEYIDWYFAGNTTRQEREKDAKDLIGGWEIAKPNSLSKLRNKLDTWRTARNKK